MLLIMQHKSIRVIKPNGYPVKRNLTGFEDLLGFYKSTDWLKDQDDAILEIFWKVADILQLLPPLLIFQTAFAQKIHKLHFVFRF